MPDNPKLSVRVSSDSVAEKVIVTDEYPDEAAARDRLRKLGWTVESVSPYTEAPVKPLVPIRVTTAPRFADQPEAAEIGIVTGECVYGTGPFKDIAAGLRNLVGGRAAGVEKLFQEARDAALIALKDEARRLGANGVVAVDLRYDTIATQQGIMQIAYAVGTAVTLADR